MEISLVDPAFWREGGAHAFARTGHGRFRLYSVISDEDRLYTDAEETSFFTIRALVELVAEIALNNDREFDPIEHGELPSDIDEAKERLLRLEHRTMADWLVLPGRTPTRGHRECFKTLEDAYDTEGGDLFTGERELLGLVLHGRSIPIGSKTLRYNDRLMEYYFDGPSPEWTADELVLLAVLVLSDEAVCEMFEEQDSSFLVQNLRPHRRELDPDERELLAWLSEQDAESIQVTGPRTASPAGPKPPDAPAQSAQTVSGSFAPIGSIVERVRAAGGGARPSDEELRTGFPDARRAFTELLVHHQLVE